jgi:uncharacterized membrane protein
LLWHFVHNVGRKQRGTSVRNAALPCSLPERPPAASHPRPHRPALLRLPGSAKTPRQPSVNLLGLITGVIFLVLAPYNQNRTVRFNAFQSIFFHVGTIVFWIAYVMLSSMLGVMTHHLSIFLTFPLSFLVGIGLFATWLYLMYSAYNGKKVILPIVGPLAEKQA